MLSTINCRTIKTYRSHNKDVNSVQNLKNKNAAFVGSLVFLLVNELPSK